MCQPSTDCKSEYLKKEQSPMMYATIFLVNKSLQELQTYIYSILEYIQAPN